MASHLLLDHLGDYFSARGDAFTTHSELLWPIYGLQFPALPFRSVGEHFGTVLQPYLLGAEILGLAILLWDYWKSKHRADIASGVKASRFALKRR
jgi:hypothetical protein